MPSAPKISVIVPTYNSEPFLAECLDSILAQDFPDCEILISDDCSTDGTVAVIEKFAARDPRIRWWRNAQNLGQAHNLNHCLREARGEFVKFVFADDKLLTPHSLRRQADALADPAVSLVGCASLVIDNQGRKLETRNHFGRDGVWPGSETLVHCLERNGNLIGEPTLVMFRRAQAARGANPAFSQLVDFEFWFHLLAQGNFAYIAEPLAAFRRHPAQLTETNRRTGRCEHEMLLLAETYFPQPWLAAATTRRMCFVQTYRLRKKYGARADDITARFMDELGRGGYAREWIHHKLTRPFRQLTHWLARRS